MPASSPAGSYPITLTDGTSANYTVTRVNGTLSINKRDLTITANNRTKTYSNRLATPRALELGYRVLITL